MAARKTKSTKADRTELIEALNAIEKEKQISKDIILEAIENSLLAACKNQFGKSENIRVNIDRETGEVKVFADYEVVEDDMIEDDALQIGITEAKLRFRDDVEVGEKVSTEVTPKNFGRIAAQKAKQVYGVEIIPQAIENAKRNAVKNGIENAEFFVGKSEEVLPEFYEKEAAAGRKAHADVIVVDPPRKGCDEKLLDTIVKMAPDRVVYVSCDSATLARDLKILCEQGYELKRVRAVDQFCHTVHTEAVCCLHRVNM